MFSSQYTRLFNVGISALVAGSILVSGVSAYAQDATSTQEAASAVSAVRSGQHSSDSETAEIDDSDGMTSWISSATISPAEAVTAATTELDGAVLAFAAGDVDGEPVFYIQIDDQIVTVSASDGDVLDTQTISRGGRDRLSERPGSGRSDSSASNASETTATAVATSDGTAEVEASEREPTSLETLLLTATVSPAEAASTAETATGDAAISMDIRLRSDRVVYVVWGENSSARVNASTGNLMETVIRIVFEEDATPVENDSAASTPAG